MEKKRCWITNNPIYIKYHDEEWGVPVHDDDLLFEFLALEGFQSGLNWELILNKREAFRKAFHDFDPKIVGNFDEEKINQLMKDPELIRNRAKILATVHNARLVNEIQKEYGSLNNYLWSFRNEKRTENICNNSTELPSETEESISMSNELKKRGFKFVGSKICYAFMQAVGMVNDHLVTCFRNNQIVNMKKI